MLPLTPAGFGSNRPGAARPRSHAAQPCTVPASYAVTNCPTSRPTSATTSSLIPISRTPSSSRPYNAVADPPARNSSRATARARSERDVVSWTPAKSMVAPPSRVRPDCSSLLISSCDRPVRSAVEVGGEDVEVLVSTPSSTADILCTCILLLPFVLTDGGPAVKACAMWLKDTAARASERPNDEVDTLIFSCVCVEESRDGSDGCLCFGSVDSR